MIEEGLYGDYVASSHYFLGCRSAVCGILRFVFFSFCTQFCSYYSPKTCGASKRSYTYGMTYEMIKRMACGLLSQKGCAMRKTDVLGLLLPNIPEFVPALHGGLMAGLAVTFANPLYTPGR